MIFAEAAPSVSATGHSDISLMRAFSCALWLFTGEVLGGTLLHILRTRQLGPLFVLLKGSAETAHNFPTQSERLATFPRQNASLWVTVRCPHKDFDRNSPKWETAQGSTGELGKQMAVNPYKGAPRSRKKK